MLGSFPLLDVCLCCFVVVIMDHITVVMNNLLYLLCLIFSVIMRVKHALYVVLWLLTHMAMKSFACHWVVD